MSGDREALLRRVQEEHYRCMAAADASRGILPVFTDAVMQGGGRGRQFQRNGPWGSTIGAEQFLVGSLGFGGDQHGLRPAGQHSGVRPFQ